MERESAGAENRTRLVLVCGVTLLYTSYAAVYTVIAVAPNHVEIVVNVQETRPALLPSSIALSALVSITWID